MTRDVEELRRNIYDLLVVGGGINGAAVADQAAARGLSVALIERRSYAGGTSSRSSKLMHGGLRYLENGELDLVAESLRERSIQLQTHPDLVHPLGFVFPVYRGDPRPLWQIRAGLWLYDVLSGRHLIKPRQNLSVEEIVRLAPEIRTEGLTGGVLYYDAQMDDRALCLRNIEQARTKGAHTADHLELVAFVQVDGRVDGVRVADRLAGNEFVIRARRVVCCAGPWTNRVMDIEGGVHKNRVRPTKGVHLVYGHRFCEHALILTIPDDGRIFFIIPWKGDSLIGTTDTDFHGDPDSVTAEDEDIRYLFRAVGRVFPGLPLTEDRILQTFAGLRPLVAKAGAPSKVSRKHVIERSVNGVFYVMGGKYTTYRAMAQDCLKRVLGKTA